MIILGVNGSPRKNGNTELLLDRALLGAAKTGAKTEKVNLGEMKYSPCLSCDNAKKTGECIVRDDMRKIFSAVKRADGFIIASPVYFGSVSAQLKMMIDRFQCHWAGVYLHKTISNAPARRGVFICVEAGDEIKFFENSRSVIKNFFVTMNIEYYKELLCTGLETKAEVMKNKSYLALAEKAGFDLVK